MPNNELVQSLRGRLPDQFSRDSLAGALQVLGQVENKMRVHQFAATLRALTDHVLTQMAPDSEVKKCPWFKQEKSLEGATRRQRALYACRGGLADDFIRNTLKINPDELHRDFSLAFQELNNRVHVTADTHLTDADEIDEFADNAIAALDGVFATIDEVHARIVDAVTKELHGEAMSAFINQTIQELDQIAGHYETGAVWLDEVKVLSLDADVIRCEIKGSVDVTLAYGSKGDRAEINESFPYECTALAPISRPTQFDSKQTLMKVDTSSWHT
jgi:hypothetical protein